MKSRSDDNVEIIIDDASTAIPDPEWAYNLEQGGETEIEDLIDSDSEETQHEHIDPMWSPSGHQHYGNVAFDKLIDYMTQHDVSIMNFSRYGFLQLTQNDQARTYEINIGEFGERKRKKDKSLMISPGGIVSLAGDFYGDPRSPITFELSDGLSDSVIRDGEISRDEIKRFKIAFKTLADSSKSEAEKILREIRKDSQAILKAVKKGKQPSLGVRRSDVTETISYSYITRNHFFGGGIMNNRYVALLQYNFDHFSHEAERAYEIGHHLAMKSASAARQAKSSGNVEEEYRLLAKAFCQELFAAHFLTDLFASGHIRTPRREIWEFCRRSKMPNPLADKVAGLLAHHMHNEDGFYGVRVCSVRCNEAWTALGDNCYLNSENENNKIQAEITLFNGLRSICDVYQGREPDFNFRDYLPKPVPDLGENVPSLFWYDKVEKVLKVRKKIDRDFYKNLEKEELKILIERNEVYEPLENAIKLLAELKGYKLIRYLIQLVQHNKNKSKTPALLTEDEIAKYLEELERFEPIPPVASDSEKPQSHNRCSLS